jgi:hypothetical protein
MRRVQKYKDELISEDQIKEKLKFNGCKPGDKKRKERTYKKLKKLLNNIKGIMNKAKSKISALEKLAKFVQKLVEIILAIVTVLAAILVILKIVIKIAKLVLNFLGGTGTGGVIGKFIELMAKAEYKINKWAEHMKVAKTWVQNQLKKLKPIFSIIAKVIAAIAAVLLTIGFLIQVLEMLYLKLIQSCALESGSSLGGGSDTEGGKLPDGSTGGGRGDNALTGVGTAGFDPNSQENLRALSMMLQNSSPEEILSRIAQTGNQEYIRYIRNANFETIGYERFNAVLMSTDELRGTIYPGEPDKLRKFKGELISGDEGEEIMLEPEN